MQIRVGHLWLLLAVGAIGAFVSLVPTNPNDFWWHLKVGDLIREEGIIPSTNRFAWTLPADRPFIHQSWLGEVWFSILFSIGGLPLIVFGRNLLAMVAFTLVGIEAQERTNSWYLAASTILFAAAMSLNNFSTRPQNWSWVLVAMVLLLLGRYSRGQLGARWLIVLPLMMIVWVNLHGGFIIGLLIIGAYIAGETLTFVLRRPGALSRERLRPLYLAGGAMALATLLNPQGIGIIGYLQEILSYTPTHTFINEWQPPNPNSLAGTFFFLGVMWGLIAFGLGRQRPSITDVILVCGFAWMAFHQVRSVIWFGMVALPIAAQCVAPKPSPERILHGTAQLPIIIIAVISLVGVGLVQPWFKPMLPLGEGYRSLFAPVPGGEFLFTDDTPVGATEHLRTMPCEGNLFHELGYGSYVIWALWPAQEVFIDTRVELYPMELWNDYIALTEGRDVEALLEQYDIACVMIDRSHQPRLIEAMAELPGWRQSYTDEQSEVWRRGASPNTHP